MESHPTQDELIAYCDGELPIDAREEIRRHVMSCVGCRRRADGVLELQRDFDGSWTRFQKEIFRPAPTPLLSVRGLLDVGQRWVVTGIRVVAETLREGGLTPRLVVPVVVADPDTTLDARDELQAASEACARGADASVRETMQRISHQKAAKVDSSEIQLLEAAAPVITVHTDARRRTIQLSVTPGANLPAGCEVRLLSGEGAERTERRAPLRSLGGTDDVFAEFDQVADGVFVIDVIAPE